MSSDGERDYIPGERVYATNGGVNTTSVGGVRVFVTNLKEQRQIWEIEAAKRFPYGRMEITDLNSSLIPATPLTETTPFVNNIAWKANSTGDTLTVPIDGIYTVECYMQLQYLLANGSHWGRVGLNVLLNNDTHLMTCSCGILAPDSHNSKSVSRDIPMKAGDTISAKYFLYCEIDPIHIDVLSVGVKLFNPDPNSLEDPRKP